MGQRCHRVQLQERNNIHLRSQGLTFHSDRGGNYRSRTMQLMLKSLCIEQALQKSHTPYDNSVSKAFFKSLKTKEHYRSIFRPEAGLKACISKHIEFFNNERPPTLTSSASRRTSENTNKPSSETAPSRIGRSRFHYPFKSDLQFTRCCSSF